MQTFRKDRCLWRFQNCCYILLWKLQLIYYLSQKLPVFFPLRRAHAVTLENPVSMGTLSVSFVSMVLKHTPAGLVPGAKHLIGIDVKVPLNLIRTIKFGQALFNKKPYVSLLSFPLFGLMICLGCSLCLSSHCHLALAAVFGWILWVGWNLKLGGKQGWIRADRRVFVILITKECFYMGWNSH